MCHLMSIPVLHVAIEISLPNLLSIICWRANGAMDVMNVVLQETRAVAGVGVACNGVQRSH